MRYADLICIGSQKAATTWLHRMLAQHPDVFMPVLKEIHYFDTLHVPKQQTFQRRRSRRSRQILGERFERSPVHRAITFLLTHVARHRELGRYVAELRFTESIWETPIDDAWYAGLFEAARGDQLTCDFTTAYALLPTAGIEHIRRLNPKARIVYIVRDPVERAISHARMLVVRNDAPRDSASLRRFLDMWFVRSHDDSVAVIDKWRANWPEDQFRVLFFDDIRKRPYDVLSEVCAFCDIPFDIRYFRGAEKPVYKGPSIPVPEEITLMLRERYASLLSELARRYPNPAAKWGQVDDPPLKRSAFWQQGGRFRWPGRDMGGEGS